MSSNAATAVTWLFVPGSRTDRFDKAVASGADLVILDLEDAVAPADKDSAREAVEAVLRRTSNVVVRINGASTKWHRDDLRLVSDHECVVMVPKAERADELEQLAQRTASGSLVALIESATGVLRASELASVSGVERLAFGNADMSAQLGTSQEDRTALLHSRSALVVASAHAQIAGPVDGVTLDLRDAGAAGSDASHARSLGFGGKLCVHPNQVVEVAGAFRPSEDELAWAQRVMDAVAEGAALGVVDGQMVDRPVVLRAEALLSRT